MGFRTKNIAVERESNRTNGGKLPIGQTEWRVSLTPAMRMILTSLVNVDLKNSERAKTAFSTFNPEF